MVHAVPLAGRILLALFCCNLVQLLEAGTDWRPVVPLQPKEFNPSVCNQLLTEKGCYTSWEFFNCDSGAAFALPIFTQSKTAQIVTDAEVSMFPTAEAAFIFAARAPPETLKKLSWVGTDPLHGENPYQGAFVMNSRIPGVWTVDELVDGGPLASSLGLIMNDTECCNKRFERTADGGVVVYFSDSQEPIKVVRDVSLCSGARLLMIDAYPLLPPNLEDPPAYHAVESELVKASELALYDGMNRGWCNVSASGLFSAVSQVIEERSGQVLSNYLQLFDPVVNRDALDARNKNDTLCGQSVDIAVTWFVAEQSDGAQSDKPGGRVNLQEDSSSYLMYHMLPGPYCEDQLIAAGSVNTMLGLATGQHLNLTFGSDEDGQVVVTVPSPAVDQDTLPASPANRTLHIVAQYSNCRSVIYILSDDFQPPALPEHVDAPRPEMAWEYLHEATRSYHYAVWQEGCFNPLPIPNITADSTEDHGTVQGSDGGQLSTLAIAGIAIGTVGGLLVLAAGVLAVILRRRRINAMDASDLKIHNIMAQPNSGTPPQIYATASGQSKRSDTSTHMSMVESSLPTSGSMMQDFLHNMPKDWVLTDVKVMKKIGQGSCGSVYVGKWHNCLVAVKTFNNIEQSTSEDLESGSCQTQLLLLHKEVSIMASLRHPNVVQFLGVTPNAPSLVMEFCQNGSLYRILRKAAAGQVRLQWKRRIAMAVDAATGMNFLHSRKDPIIHRDLRSPNLLVDQSWSVKVSDFGLSKFQDLAQANTSITGFNPRWLAPELHGAGGRSSTASDVYSFGIIMWELLTLQQPFKDLANAQIIFGVVDCGLRPGIPSVEDLPGGDSYPGLAKYTALMQRCWAQEVENRPTFKQVVEELQCILVVDKE